MILASGVSLIIGRLTLTIINFSVIVILARLITPSAFGIIALSQAVILLCQGILEASFGSFLIQRRNLSANLEHTTTITTIIIGSVMTLVVISTAPFLASIMNAPEISITIQLLSITILLTSISNTSYNMMLRHMRFKTVITTEVISIGIIRGGISLLLAFNGYSYWAVVYAMLCSQIVWASIFLILHPISLPYRLSAKSIIGIIRFTAPVSASNIMSMLALKIDNFIIGRFFGQITLGYYSRAYATVDLASSLLGSVFRTVILTGISKNNRMNTPNVQESQNQFFVAHVSAIICIWPIALTSIIAAPEIIKILLGEQWAQTVPLFQILAVGMFLRIGYKVSSSFNVAYGLVRIEVPRFFIFLIVMSLSTYIGAQVSLLAVTFAVLFSLFVFYILLTLITTSHLKIDNLLFAKNIMKPVIAMFLSIIISSALCYQLRRFFFWDVYIVITVLIIQLILVSLYVKIIGKHDNTIRLISDTLTSYIKKYSVI